LLAEMAPGATASGAVSVFELSSRLPASSCRSRALGSLAWIRSASRPASRWDARVLRRTRQSFARANLPELV